ncbi:MAG: hypothetical protein JSS27_13350 [Planctomycetes bacterium]|nr:hypothetical protein [Planctomycetota bacterium]
MSLSRYANQLQRELKANQKKAAMLGLLGLVAVWFWLPLLMPKSTAAAAPAPSPVAAGTAPAPASPINHDNKAPTWRWQDLDQWMTADLETKPFVWTEDQGRNPFALVKLPPSETEIAEAQAKAAQQEQAVQQSRSVCTPQESGLELSSTMIARVRKATINGKTYQLGDEVPVSRAIVFTLVGVEVGHVVLAREGSEFPLKIRRNTMTSNQPTGKQTAAALTP